MCVLADAEQGGGLKGDFLRKLLRSAGLSYERVWATFLFHCPTRGKIPTKADLQQCKKWLWRELTLVRPKVVFAFGMGPTSLLLRAKPDLAEVVGKPSPQPYLPGGETVVVPMYGLDKLLKGPLEGISEAVSIIEEHLED